MEVLTGNKKEMAKKHLQKATDAARLSTCKRGHCGTVIVKDGEVIGRGFNSPPKNNEENRKCDIKTKVSDDFKSDDTGCIHAEQRAIMHALKSNENISGSTLYFVRVDGAGEVTFAGEPYCTICSKMALDVGVKTFVLWHEDGITAYETKEYNDLSFQYGK